MHTQGLSQAELARALCYERTTVCKHLKSGIRSLTTAAKYADALSVPLSALLPQEQSDWEIIKEIQSLGIEVAIRSVPDRQQKEETE